MTERSRLALPIISIGALTLLVLGVGFIARQGKIGEERVRERYMGVSSTPILEQRFKIHERENRELKERSWLVSPSGKKTAYFQHKLTTDLSEIEEDDYTQLIIEENNRPETVFVGNFRVSFFEWLSDTEIAVYQDCGTECVIAYHIDLMTKQRHRFSLGVGYTWSPNRDYVLAYHLSLQQGISIGDKFGSQLFTLRRDSPPSLENYSPHRASWSPDSSKLVLIIHKEGRTKLELLIFNVEDNFKLLMQKDLENNEFSDLGWKDAKTVFYEVNGRILELAVLP